MTHRVEPRLIKAPRQIWRTLREFPAYEVSNDGFLRRAVACHCRKKGARIMISMRNGYPSYGLTRDGKRFYRGAHLLVASEFLPLSPPGKPNVLHHDDDRLNCCDTNLKWGDHLDNMRDARRNRRFNYGADHFAVAKPWLVARGTDQPNSKLTDDQARSIKFDLRTQAEIAAQYGVSQTLVSGIKRGVRWTHI